MNASPMDTDNFDQELCLRPETDSFDLAQNSPATESKQPQDVVMTNKNSQVEAMDVDEDDEENEYLGSPHNGRINPSSVVSPIMDENSLRPIAILIDELGREDLQARLNAMQQLKTIASVLGPIRTREELIPYLTDMIDDDDEILMVLIEELIGLIDFVGGHEHLMCFIPPYERLCVVEERIIRDAAVSKLSQVIGSMPKSQYPLTVLPLLERLCESDWHTARVSGCMLIGQVFSEIPRDLSYSPRRPSLSENDDPLIPRSSNSSSCSDYVEKMFETCCTDSIPVVRRACVEAIGLIVASGSTEKSKIISHYIPLFQKLVSDSQDNVRVLAPTAVLSFGEPILTRDECTSHLILCIRPLIFDSSWRVRYIVASKYCDLCDLLNENVIARNFVDGFVRLCKDQEAEVRAASCSQLPRFMQMIGMELSVTKVLPVVSELVDDINKHTRASLASVLMDCVNLFESVDGNDEIVVGQLLPCVLKVLKDEYSTVRLHIISNLNVGKDGGKKKMIDVSMLEQSLVPAITDLAKDSDWRVRIGIIEKIPNIAMTFGKSKENGSSSPSSFVKETIFPLCAGWLCDQVDAVRKCGALNLKRVAMKFVESSSGSDEIDGVMNAFIEIVMDMKSKNHYLHRMIGCIAAFHLSDICCHCLMNEDDQRGKWNEWNNILVQEMILFCAQQDSVPNVRFKACQMINEMVNPKSDENGKKLNAYFTKPENVLRCAETFENISKHDGDPDVKYFASLTWKSVSALLG